MQSLATRGLHDDLEAELVEDVAQVEGHAPAVEHRGRRAGIEVEDDGRRVPRIGHRPLMGVQLERGEVGQPDERGQLLYHASLVPAPGHDGLGWDPFRMMRRAALLEEPLAVRAVGCPHQRGRATLQVREHDRRDSPVIVDDVRFLEPRGGVEDLVEVRQGQRATLDVYVNSCRHR